MADVAQPQSARPGPGGQEVAVLLVLGAVVAVCGFVWLTGGVAGVVFGDRWPRIGLADALGVVGRLPDRLSDPALAWPRAAWRDLPGSPAELYLSAFMVLVAFALAGWLALSTLGLSGRPWLGGRAGALGAQRREWASGRELSELRVRGPGADRLMIGRTGRGGRLLATPAQTHLVLVAPTRSGKTSRGIIPWLLEHEGPAVVLSTKTDVLRGTRDRRGELGRVWVFDPFGMDSSAWSPLLGCEYWDTALQVAEWLGDAAEEAQSSEAGRFWRGEAATLLAPLLHAAGLHDAGIAQVLRWLDTREEGEVHAALSNSGSPAPLEQMQGIWRLDPRNQGTTYMSAAALLKAYRYPRVQAHCRVDDLCPEAFLADRANTVYVVAPENQQQQLRPLIVALVSQLYVAAVEQASLGRASGGHSWDPSVLFLLDEAANIAPLRSLPNYLAQGLGLGLRFVTVWQDLAQVHARYGPAWQSVMSNSEARLFLGPMSDPTTLDFVAKLLGDVPITHQTETRGLDRADRVSTTQTTMYRPLATVPQLRRLERDRGLLLCGRLPPAWVRLRPWYSDRSLQRLAGDPDDGGQ